MNANMVMAAVVVAGLAGGVARAGDVVILRGETDREHFDRTGMVRGVDARSADGAMMLAQAQAWRESRMTKAERDGERAGAEAVQLAGRHAAHLSDSEIMRRAKAAGAKAGYRGDDAEQFAGKFGAAFTTARMNARRAK